jgi:hypothetical protein
MVLSVLCVRYEFYLARGMIALNANKEYRNQKAVRPKHFSYLRIAPKRIKGTQKYHDKPNSPACQLASALLLYLQATLQSNTNTYS